MATSTRALASNESARVRARMTQIKDDLGSQLMAARKIGISQQVYSRILAGDPAGLHVAKKVAAYDRMPVDVLLAGSQPALEAELRAHPKRWAEPAIAAVRKAAASTIERPGAKTREEWRIMLDRSEEALDPIVREIHRR